MWYLVLVDFTEKNIITHRFIYVYKDEKKNTHF